MRLLLALTLLLLPLAGCLDGGDDTGSTDDTPDDSTDDAMDDPEPQPEDRGEYIYHPDTGLCEAKDYTDVGDSGEVYQSDIGGGTWVFAETNGIPGLQYEDNHPLSGEGAGFELPVDGDCMDGDQTTV